MNRFLLLLLLVPVSACAQKADSTGQVEVGSAASAAAASDTAFIKACVETSNMGEALCTCTARKAREDLSETGYAFLLATLQEDEEQTEKLRQEMAIQEAVQAGMFLVNAPRVCAGG